MTKEEFVNKMRELDPFHSLKNEDEEVSLDRLYDRFVIIVEEMERLEDLEDETIQLKAYIDYLKEKLKGEADES